MKTQTPPLTLSNEATLVSILLDDGWVIHLASNSEDTHQVVKVSKNNNITHIERCAISADIILDLKQADLIRRKTQFTINGKTTTVYIANIIESQHIDSED